MPPSDRKVARPAEAVAGQGWPVVPVVNRADFRKLEGIISQRDVLDRYREFGEG